MATINIAKIRKAHNSSTPEVKALLEEACGVSLFTGDVMDRVKTLQDACNEIGKDYNVEFSPERLSYETEDETAYREWKIIQEALNEGEELDYSNTKQQKWTIYVNWVSGRGLALGGVDYDGGYTCVGPRLSFVSGKKARYAFTQFPNTFKRFFNNHLNK